MPRIKAFRVAGLFELGMNEYDSNMIFTALPTAQLFFQVPDAVTSLNLRRRSRAGAAPPGAAPDIVGDKGRIFDWQQANSSFFNAIQVERNVMFLILTLIIVVAAFNIISSMIMMVKDKGRDIAIMRTMGATRGMILRIFMLAGASVGVVGTIAGFVLGVVFCANIESIRRLIENFTGSRSSTRRSTSSRSSRRRSTRAKSPSYRDGARALVPRDHLSLLARGAPRSGRGAPV